MFVEAVLESSFGFSYVLFVTTIALYHVNNVFRVTVNVMMNGSCLICLKVEEEHVDLSSPKVSLNSDLNRLKFLWHSVLRSLISL